MENQTTSTKQIAVSYGLILGFLSIVISIITYAMGTYLKSDWKTTTLGFAILILTIVLGLIKVKKNNKGFLSVTQALKTGLGIAMIGAIVSVVYTFIFAKFIEPNFINQAIELQQQKMLVANPNLTDEQIEKAMSTMSKFFYPILFGSIFIANLFFGFIISLIAGLVMKKVPEQEY